MSFEWFPFTKVKNMSLFCVPREPKGGSPPQAAFKSKDPAISSGSAARAEGRREGGSRELRMMDTSRVWI